MKKIETEIGSVYVVETPYWAGEHSFTHHANSTINARFEYSDHVHEPFTDLWAIDIYTRSGLNPLKHNERHYIWADADPESAARIAMQFVNDNVKVLITHIVPLNDRLREPNYSFTAF